MNPYIKLDHKYFVSEISNDFSSSTSFDIKVGDDFARNLSKLFKQPIWCICVDDFIQNMGKSLNISHVLFTPSTLVANDQKIPAIQYWFLQTIAIGNEKMVIFHDNKFISALDQVFVNFLDYTRGFQNDVAFHYHRRTRSINKHIYMNPFIYAFFMPYLAKANFHLAPDKLFTDYFGMSVNQRVRSIIQLELDQMFTSARSIDLRKFREEYLSKNYIPFMQITFPMIIPLFRKDTQNEI